MGSTSAEALNNSAALFGFSLLFIISGYLEVVVLTQDLLWDAGLGQATVWGFGVLVPGTSGLGMQPSAGSWGL